MTNNQKRHTRTRVLVQRELKNGGWGTPYMTTRFGNETPEQVVQRLEKLNNKKYRVVNEDLNV